LVNHPIRLRYGQVPSHNQLLQRGGGGLRSFPSLFFLIGCSQDVQLTSVPVYILTHEGIALKALCKKQEFSEYLEEIQIILSDKSTSNDHKIKFFTWMLYELEARGKFVVDPIEDRFIERFSKQPTVTEFISKIEEEN
jgi:hypothetical protein